MHAGTPVIASSAVGAAAGGLVVHGATGLIARDGDDEELAGAIRLILTDAAVHERVSGLGRTLVAGYTYEAAADAFGEALRATGVATG
jgi:glycosyltransferase involved in cell wall biosynthesis